MAEHLIVKYRTITNPAPPTFISGHYFETVWDDVAEAFVVYHGSLFDGSVPRHSISSGPDIGAIDIDHVELTAIHPIPYSFCDGLNLQTFEIYSLFPYAKKISTPNHFACTSTVCDLQISDDFTIQPASDFTTADGAVEVTATSSNGAIKFSLNPSFDYASQGQGSGLFSGLYPGGYTITAKDELGCIDQITVTIPVPDFYNPLYRVQYYDHNGLHTRTDILERGFEGAVTDVVAGQEPVVIRYNSAGQINKFLSVTPSELRLTLMSQSNFYFRDLFTQDERKYQVKHYKDYGNESDAFTPAVLDTLDLWTNIDTPNRSWLTGLVPTVSFISTSGNSQSDLYKTVYSFEAGRDYTFNYDFEATGYTGSGSGQANATFELAIVDVSNNVLINKLVSVGPETPNAIGSYSFLCPSDADGIAIRVRLAPAVADQRFRINAFTNATPSDAGGDAGFELEWMGYLIPNNYSESYLAPPYAVQITATDGLADLKNYDFVDKDGNEFKEDINTLTAICEILKKTDLGISIQSSINRYEADMDQTATDDPLNQCKFNPDTFYHDGKDCSEALAEILKPFGARIVQRKAKWFIYSIEEAVTTMDYREFTNDGVFITNGTITDTVNIDGPAETLRAAFRDRLQTLEIVGSYGKLFFEHTLLKHSSLVKSYSFELEDLYPSPSGLNLFKNWNVNIIDAPGAVFGIKKTKSFEGEYNFFATRLESITDNLPTATTGGIQVVLSAAAFPIEFTNKDAFEFRFNYAVLLKSSELVNSPYSAPRWTRIRWTLKIGSYYYNQSANLWSTDSAYSQNPLYVSTFNSTEQLSITGIFRDVVQATTEQVQIIFYLEGVNYSDFTSLNGTSDDLKSITTIDKAPGYKVRGKESTIVPYRNYYVLEESTDAESSPDIIRPDDYAASTNEKVWSFEGYSTRDTPVDYIFIDNVVLLHHPNAEEAPEDVTIRRDNNPGIKVDFEEAFLLNDIDIDNINNSEQTYKNYFKLLNGEPTQTWARTYRVGEGKLLELVSNDYVSQYKTPTNKLTGSFITDTPIRYTSVLSETGDSNKKYMFMGYELRDRAASITFDILELKDTVTDDESDDIDADFNTDFSLDFES